MYPEDWPSSTEEMARLDPEAFESFVASVWDARGYDTETIQLSRDRGQDVVATKNGERHVLQAKRHSPSNHVGGPDVQQYASILHDETVDGVTVVTSSSFTKPAYQRASEMGVDLVDGQRLLDYADSYRAQYEPEDNEEPESTPDRRKTGQRGRLFAVSVTACAYLIGIAALFSGANSGSILETVGILGLLAGFFGLPVAVGIDVLHLRKHDANYQPSMLWPVASLLTVGVVGLWYLTRRLFRTNLRKTIR